MVEISSAEYSELLSLLASAKNLIETWVILWIILFVLGAINVFFQFRSLPDKETRRNIKKFAKEKHVKDYQIVNAILKAYFNQE